MRELKTRNRGGERIIANITISDLSINCANPVRMRVKRICHALVSDKELLVLFMPCDFDDISPYWREKTGKQQKQMHFIFQVDHLLGAVEETIRLGAVEAAAQYGGDYFVTMIDPEGRSFYFCKK